MPRLFDPLTLRGVTLRNRIGVSPMQQGAATNGAMSDWHLMHLGSLALGGVGLIIGEVTAVTPEGRISPGDLAIWHDHFIEPLARVAHFVHDRGPVFGLQLGHAGRRGSVQAPWHGGAPILPAAGGWELVAPSALPFVADDGSSGPKPRELTTVEIGEIVQAFADGARRAHTAGVRWLEIHAAHGYLHHSFHSPLSNHRGDHYGGSFENRIRFTRETVQAIRTQWPDSLPFSVRISCTEYVDGGWTLEDSIELARRLKGDGVDLIDCSSGAGWSSARARGPGFQVPFAERIRREAAVPTAAVGRITEATHADEIVYHERADLVLLGRHFLYEPRWAMRAAEALGRPMKLQHPHGHYV